MAPGSRRKARGFALQVLYARDVDRATDVGGALGVWGASFELDVDEPAHQFATELVTRSVEELAAIDEVIASASRNWRLERMSRVDRNILRLAVCELRSFTQTPVKVVINEAVELAKRFGTAESPAFVNGILDRIAAGLGRSSES
ncbi:MAG: transcription antitermination factor NusB [Kofleriaceae bacterium]|nr:transcription antitermination factor NusB [Myxococcales bacterium]MCB9564075.1 transcription antitermination factor NusB [Kofleriaceae bacterium]MCB9572556.1 transcription antitermination factor NusB [Kofleriaceae bacterium]